MSTECWSCSEQSLCLGECHVAPAERCVRRARCGRVVASHADTRAYASALVPLAVCWGGPEGGRPRPSVRWACPCPTRCSGG